MSETYNWCKDKTRLAIWDKPVFCVNRVGNKYWYLNDKLHRENGPAIEYVVGSYYWYLNGKVHRENGPAIELVNYVSGTKHRCWYLNDERYSESDYWKELKECYE